MAFGSLRRKLASLKYFFLGSPIAFAAGRRAPASTMSYRQYPADIDRTSRAQVAAVHAVDRVRRGLLRRAHLPLWVHASTAIAQQEPLLLAPPNPGTRRPTRLVLDSS